MDGSVIVIGVRFDGASPLAIDRASVEPLLRVVADDGIEAALLATGERTELHLVGTDAADAIERFHRALRSEGLLGEGAPCVGGDPYVAVGDAAVLHLARVAAGLDSNVLGDHDALAQVRGALALAEGAGTSGPVLRSAYRCAIAAGRRSRATTSIATGGTEVADVLVTLADGQAVGQEHHLRRLAGAVEAERVVRVAVARWADDQLEEVAA